MQVGAEDFREAVSRLANAVAIVTTLAHDGTRRGITATSVCSLSLHPPLLIVCLDRNLASYPDFARCRNFGVNVLRADHVPLARLFATRGAAKFEGPLLRPSEFGLPSLPDALVRVICSAHDRRDFGDHSILVGLVEHLAMTPGEPVVYFARRYHRLVPYTP